MHVSDCLGWLRTEENQFLAVPLDAVRAMPRVSQDLLGFAAHDAFMAGGGYLGAVELQHPVTCSPRARSNPTATGQRSASQRAFASSNRRRVRSRSRGCSS